MSADARFREITPVDVPALFVVRTATRENPYSLEALRAIGITEESVRAKLASVHRGWLAEVDGRIVGFAMGDSSSGELLVVAVLPEFEGRGLGRGLIERIQDWLWSHGWPELWLVTGPDTATRAFGFYRRLGWLDCGIKDGQRVMKLTRPGG
jgi:GNAT superfamily N-acetyltransferase